MSLTETKIIDQISVNDENIVFIRESNIVLRDNVEISRTYHRTSLTPNQDVSIWPKKVQEICAAAWKD
jgi:hypothetical protein